MSHSSTQEKLRKAQAAPKAGPDVTKLREYADKLTKAEAEIDKLRAQLAQSAAGPSTSAAATSSDPLKKVGVDAICPLAKELQANCFLAQLNVKLIVEQPRQHVQMGVCAV